MTVPSTLNGYPVIYSETSANGISTILVEKRQEFVVATWAPILKNEWSWGHYFPFTSDGVGRYDKITALQMAMNDFAETSKRNFNR